MAMLEELESAAAAADFHIYGQDFLCRALAIIYCYGGGPGGEYFRAPTGNFVAQKGAQMLDEAIRQKDWQTVKKFQGNAGSWRNTH